MSSKVTLNSGSTTIHGNKTTTTTKDPKYTMRTEQTLGGFYNPDGTPNEAAYADYEAQKRAAAASYGVDPETGRVKSKYITDILGVDPDVMRKKREEEEALNKQKMKEDALYKGLSVLFDMGTTAIGGNVWQRPADRRAKEYHDANQALIREQQAEDINNANKLRGTERAYAAAVQKIHDSVGKAYSTKVSRTQETGGGSKAITTQESDVTKGWRQALDKSKDGSGSGSGGGKMVSVGIIDSNGKLSTKQVTSDQASNLVEHAKVIYTQAINDGNDELLQNFLQKGIVKTKQNEDGTYTYTWDDAALQRSGYLFYGGGDSNIDASIKDYYRQITKDTRPIVPVTGSCGRLSGNSTNVRRTTR